MLTFTLSISRLTTFTLLWFMDWTFQVSMQYCSLQYRTLLPSPVTSTMECCFCFGSVSSFYLVLFLHSSPIAYQHLPTWGVHLSRSYHFAFSYCSYFILLGSKITADGDCSHEIKRRLLLGRKVMINLGSTFKSRDITLPTKVRLVKAMVFPVVMYGGESWTIKKVEHRRIDTFELWLWRRLLRVPWTAKRSNQSILKEISPECSL